MEMSLDLADVMEVSLDLADVMEVSLDLADEATTTVKPNGRCSGSGDRRVDWQVCSPT